MPEALLFVEDAAQEVFLKKLVERLACNAGLILDIRVRNAQGGSGHTLKEVERFEVRWKRQKEILPDVIIVAVDANCKGYSERRRQVDDHAGDLKDLVVHAIPDPHIERWLLLDGKAFKDVLGRGCQAPDEKCEKNRYKYLLSEAVKDAGAEPLLGGIEYAEDLAERLDVQRVCRQDDSFKNFIKEYHAIIKRLKKL